MSRALTTAFVLAVALVCYTVAGPRTALAQLNPFAPTGAMDTMAAGSPTGGLNAATYTGAAQQAAAAAAQQNPFAMQAPPSPFGPQAGQFGPAGGPAPFAPSPFSPEGGMAGGFPGGYTPQFAAQPVVPSLPSFKVLTGERVYSRLQLGTSPPELLQDAEIVSVMGMLQDIRTKYYDDGTHGDIKANDGIWSYVTERNDVISPAEFRIMTRIVASLVAAEQTQPHEFFQLPVTTTDPLSQLPQNMEWEAQRDDKISEWNRLVLREFRMNTDDITSRFWPVFVPPPPMAPEMEIPPGFDPTGKTVGGAITSPSGYGAYPGGVGADPYGGGSPEAAGGWNPQGQVQNWNPDMPAQAQQPPSTYFAK